MTYIHLRRVAGEQASQLLMIFAGLADRVILTAVLLRVWGVDRFETWSVCVALASLITLFEFGFNLYFNNRLMEEHEQGRLGEAARTYYIANTIFICLALFGLAVALLILAVRPLGGVTEHPSGMIVVVVFATGYALRLAANASLSLFRANRQYARLVLFLALGELSRVVVAVLACLAGGDLLIVAVASTLTASIIQVVCPVIYAWRRFHPHRFALQLPLYAEISQAFITSTKFFAQGVPVILLGALPVLYLDNAGLAAGVLATFVLMRTLSGLPRALLQQSGIVFGQEIGRRLAVRDSAGAFSVVRESARLYSVLSGVVTGFLLGSGHYITLLWTGTEENYQFVYLAVGLLSMMFAAVSVLSHNILTATNAPGMAALGRWLQVVIAFLFVTIAPVSDPALAMLLGLALGEIFGFSPLSYVGVNRLVPKADWAFHLREIFFTLAVAASAGWVTMMLLNMFSPQTILTMCLSLGLAGIAVSLFIPTVGLRRNSRDLLFQATLVPILARLGIETTRRNDT